MEERGTRMAEPDRTQGRYSSWGGRLDPVLGAASGIRVNEIRAGGRRLECAWHGPGPEAAPTLVFLHEGLGSASTWRGFPARLAAATGCGALVYSRAGHGGSDPVPLPRPLRFMHDEAQESLPEVLRAAGIREAVLVGHSDGASIALIHAGTAATPGLRGLALEAPHVFVEDVSVRSIEAAAERYRSGDLRPALARHHGANVEVAFWGWNRAWLDPGFRNWNLQGELPGIRVPVLLIQGQEDEYGTLRQLDAIEKGCAGPVQRLVLERCGHAPHRDQPERTLEAMAAFVRGILGGSGRPS
jgi:pimeloyl-ACP methyl ester carboxylesterase